MGYKALISLELPEASDKERNKFHEILTKENWVKIENMPSAWTLSFYNNIERHELITHLITHIGNAKFLSGVTVVKYAIQAGKGDVVVG